MSLLVDRMEGEEQTSADRRRRIDVTDMDAAGVRSFVRDSLGTEDVSLEHRGGRTYLVVEE